MSVLIVGAGLFGAVARDVLRTNGVECYTIDDGRPFSGSYPAGCLTKPSWLTKVAGRDEALEELNSLYGLKEIPLRIAGVKSETIFHVPPAAILIPPDISGRVVHIAHNDGAVHLEDGRSFYGDQILVAAGVWSKQLLPEHFAGVPLTGLKGSSQRFRGTLPEAQLKVWAPFKQSVAFNIAPNEIWFGDGTALRAESFKEHHIDRAMKHAVELGLSQGQLIESRVGLRPYVKGQTGWFRHVSKNCWVSTGGAKNGVVLAAAQALQFLRSIP